MTTKHNSSSNSKLQKTISNLISNVISTLCQQIIQYEQSIDIFGVLNLNIDNDVDICAKINEKFVKKEAALVNHKPSSSNPQISRILDIVQHTKKQYDYEVANIDSERMNDNDDIVLDVVNNCIKDNENIDNANINNVYKRRPRKPNQTFKHVITDNVDNSARVEDETKHSSASDLDDKSLKIDTRLPESFSESNDKMDCEVVYPNDAECADTVNEAKADDKQNESITFRSPIKSTTNSKFNYKCTICDRQFKRKFCLTRHKRIHQNFKTYTCNICGLGFDLINQLKRHLRNSHTCNRENLRRSCRTDSKIDGKVPICSSMECSWALTSNKIINSSKAATNVPLDAPKTSAFNSTVPTITKRPLPSQFQTTMSTPTTTNTYHQVRQLLNNIMMTSEPTNALYPNPMYFMPPYSTILPAYTQTNTCSVATTSVANNNPALSSIQKYIYPSTMFSANQSVKNLTSLKVNSNRISVPELSTATAVSTTANKLISSVTSVITLPTVNNTNTSSISVPCTSTTNKTVIKTE